MTAPAGWYMDPDGTGQLRWWDGQIWTQHRQAPQGPPMIQASAVPQVPPAPAQFGGFAPPQQQQPQWNAMGTTIPNSASAPRSPLFVLAWVGIVAMLVGPFLNWLT